MLGEKSPRRTNGPLLYHDTTSLKGLTLFNQSTQMPVRWLRSQGRRRGTCRIETNDRGYERSMRSPERLCLKAVNPARSPYDHSVEMPRELIKQG